MRYFVLLLCLATLMTSCYTDDDNRTAGPCSAAVKAGENFMLDDRSITLLSLESDLWCVCCEVCDCFAAPLAILLVNGDTVRIGGEFFSLSMQPQVGVHEGRVITMDFLSDGNCENRLAPEDFSACFSID